MEKWSNVRKELTLTQQVAWQTRLGAQAKSAHAQLETEELCCVCCDTVMER